MTWLELKTEIEKFITINPHLANVPTTIIIHDDEEGAAQHRTEIDSLRISSNATEDDPDNETEGLNLHAQYQDPDYPLSEA